MNNHQGAKVVLAIAIFILIVGLSACDQLLRILSDDEMPQTMDAAIPQLTRISGEVVIGLVSPQTGRFAAYGPQAAGTGLALEEINNAQLGDARIEFITVDDRSTPEGAVDAFNNLIQAGVTAIYRSQHLRTSRGNISDCTAKSGCCL